MLHKNLSAIFEHFLETLGSDHHFDFGIFIQKPLPSVQKRPQNEEDSDVWLYLTHDDITCEIPRHGRWHPNSMSPYCFTHSWKFRVTLRAQNSLQLHYTDKVMICRDKSWMAWVEGSTLQGWNPGYHARHAGGACRLWSPQETETKGYRNQPGCPLHRR